MRPRACPCHCPCPPRSYGTGRLNGRSEQLLGRFLKEYPGSERAQGEVRLATKVTGRAPPCTRSASLHAHHLPACTLHAAQRTIHAVLSAHDLHSALLNPNPPHASLTQHSSPTAHSPELSTPTQYLTTHVQQPLVVLH